MYLLAECHLAETLPYCGVWLQVAQSYGLLLGTIVMVPKTAQTLAAILMLTFILTGGYFVRGLFQSPGFITASVDIVILLLGYICQKIRCKFWCVWSYAAMNLIELSKARSCMRDVPVVEFGALIKLTMMIFNIRNSLAK